MSALFEKLTFLKASIHQFITALSLPNPPGLISFIVTLPNTVDAPRAITGPQFHFAHGVRKQWYSGYGTAIEWQAAGPQRWMQLRGAAQVFLRNWRHIDIENTGITGRAMLGLAAAPEDIATAGALPNALLWVPELALCHVQENSFLILTLATPFPEAKEQLIVHCHAVLERFIPYLIKPSITITYPPTTHFKPVAQFPDQITWDRLVNSALQAITTGQLQKVVLSRYMCLQALKPIDTDRVVAALRRLFPTCQVIDLQHSGTRFIAATPERLVTLAKQQVEVDAIAGTALRGASATQDQQFTALLTHSQKDLHEHAVVVNAICKFLAACCHSIVTPVLPSVLKLDNVQHLWSLVQGQLHTEWDLFQLAEVLHPTPATNGQPRQAAQAWRECEEQVKRGWYTGVAGLIAPDLSGELWVLLRCASIQHNQATLFAGAGIVAGSDPHLEWQETEEKMAAMRSALQFA